MVLNEESIRLKDGRTAVLKSPTEADAAELAAIIEQRTAAYISDKGAALGVTCHAEVETELRSGVPYPCAVTLDVERDEALAACIAADLGISEEKQTWQPSRTR